MQNRNTTNRIGAFLRVCRCSRSDTRISEFLAHVTVDCNFVVYCTCNKGIHIYNVECLLSSLLTDSEYTVLTGGISNRLKNVVRY